jgi:hypothetical protein
MQQGGTMKNPNISVPIDRKLYAALKADVRRTGLSRADIVRQILRRHYGLLMGQDQKVA